METRNKKGKRKNINDLINEPARMMNCGMMAKIIGGENNKNLTIQFEDGTTVFNKQYINFITGNIRHPKYSITELQKQERLGKTVIANCGMKCSIIKYINSTDIDVMFEDGVVVKNVTYCHFVIGNIRHPNYGCTKKSERIGESAIMNCGERCTIIAYRGRKSIDVMFDDGTIVYNREYKDFQKGQIANPTTKK